MNQETSVRPTKKQRELLEYIDDFIKEHGYSPSYREIMTGLSYTSVATVALHVNSLIRRGHLRKRDRSARSLEVVHAASDETRLQPSQRQEEGWLFGKVEALVDAAKQPDSEISSESLETLFAALDILGYQAAAQGLKARWQSQQTRSN